MLKKQINFFFVLVGMFYLVSVPVIAEKESNNFFIKSVWQINMIDVFEKSTLSKEFSPVLVGTKLVFSDMYGHVKTIDTETKQIESIAKIPLNVTKSFRYQSDKLTDYVILFGKHQLSSRYYYVTLDIVNKRTKGVVNSEKLFVPFGEFAIYEKFKNFIVFNPKKGKGVYRQKTDYNIESTVFTEDRHRYVFQTPDHDVYDIERPNFAPSIMMSKKKEDGDSKKNKILSFKHITKLKKGVYADNIQGDKIYYHKKDGHIGKFDTSTQTIDWERKYFKLGMEILGPIELDTKLYYLVSYPQNDKRREFEGKIICLNQKTGNPLWISEDISFYNFGVVKFDDYILASSKDGDLLFLDKDSGNIEGQINVGEGISKPIISEREIYVMTKETIYKLENTSIKYKIKLFFKKIKKFIT